MASLESKAFDSPDETRTPEKTKVELVNLEGTTVGRYTFQPGWRWSECVKPVAKTESCQVDHVGYVVKGRLHVVHDDGTEAAVGPGAVYHVRPGHDAWVEGSEEFVAIEFQGAADYAKS
jgi:mannose-6-phosphate isomerase-like protein (cupin superfamily)